MASLLAHLELPQIMPWLAVLTLKLWPYAGVIITTFPILFLMEVLLNDKNFVATFFLNKLAQTLPLNIRTHPFPTNNRCYERAGAAPHFDTLKAILL